MKIHPDNFRWYGSFHNESHHPHLHLICYSTKPGEGYLTRHGIEKMKSALTNEIFKQELTPIYAHKSAMRDEMKLEAKKVFHDLATKKHSVSCENPVMNKYISELHRELKNVKGKKQYGYLRPQLKSLVDKIVDELAKEPSVGRAYGLWNNLQNEVNSFYRDDEPIMLPLSEQKTFKSIKNMIIQAVAKIDYLQLQSQASVNSCVINLLNSLGKIFVRNIPQDSTTTHQHIDSKLMRKLR